MKRLNLQFGTEHKLAQEHNACLCLSRETYGNDQSFWPSAYNPAQEYHLFMWARWGILEFWQIAPHVGLSLKFVTVFSPPHISNRFFSKALKKKKNPGAIQKIFSWLLGANNICSQTSVLFPSYFFPLLSREKKFNGMFIHRGTSL